MDCAATSRSWLLVAAQHWHAASMVAGRPPLNLIARACLSPKSQRGRRQRSHALLPPRRTSRSPHVSTMRSGAFAYVSCHVPSRPPALPPSLPLSLLPSLSSPLSLSPSLPPALPLSLSLCARCGSFLGNGRASAGPSPD